MTHGVEAVELETMLLGRHMAPHRRYARSESHLDRSAYTLLNRLAVQGPMSIGQLSEAFGLDVSTLNRQTAAMVKADLVDRIPDPDGGLARKFRITAHGRTQLAAERDANLAGLRRVLVDWPAEDVDRLATLLRRFNTDIERLDGRPWPRP